MSKKKQFSSDLHSRNDVPAREAVLTHFRILGLHCRNNPDQYGPDLLYYGTGFRTQKYIEVEIKHSWPADSPEFPFPTVQVPERKMKFCRGRTPIEFWILRADRKRAMIIPGSVLRSSPSTEVPNKYMSKGEFFRQVPVSHCTQIELETGNDNLHVPEVTTRD